MPFIQALSPRLRVTSATLTYFNRKARSEFPAYKWDVVGNPVPELQERRECCRNVPNSMMWLHMHSVLHCANLYDADPVEVMKEIRNGRRKFFGGREPSEPQMLSLRLTVADYPIPGLPPRTVATSGTMGLSKQLSPPLSSTQSTVVSLEQEGARTNAA